MSVITTTLLQKLAPAGNVTIFSGLTQYLDTNFQKYQINNHLRISHFLGQSSEESDGFKTLTEYASGQEYEGRKDLGNVNPGDGVRYKGRGIFQLTGRANYRQMGTKIGVDLENNPGLAATPEISVLTACEFWNTKGLSVYADRDDVNTITLRINGGTNGLINRIHYTTLAKSLVPVDPINWNTPIIYYIDPTTLIALVKKSNGLANFLSDTQILADVQAKLPTGILLNNGYVTGLDKNSQAYKDFVQNEPNIPIDTLLVPVYVVAAYGDISDNVKTLQHLLNLKNTSSPIGEDGKFFGQTLAATKAFQISVGLNVTGIIDNIVYGKLKE